MNSNTAKKIDMSDDTREVMPWLKSYPENLRWDIEIPQKPLFALLEDSVKKFAKNDAVVFQGHRYSYAALWDLVNRAARGLQDWGVKKGVKVGLFLPNCAYSVVMYYAVLRAGGTVVNFNPVYVERDLIYQVEDSETDIFVTTDAAPLLDKVKALLEKTRLSKVVVCPAGQNLLETVPVSGLMESLGMGALSFSALINNQGNPAPVMPDVSEDLAVLQYTGGTTGISKGAALTHRSVVSNAAQIGAWFHNIEEGKDKMVGVLPLFHVFAMTVVMNMTLIRGMTLYIMPAFDVKEMLNLIQTEKPSYLAAVPAMLVAMANYDRIGEYDFSSLKFCLSGGAPLPAEVKAQFEQKTGAKLVAEGYGLSEFAPVGTCNPLSERARAGSIGLPVPQTIVEIISLVDGETVLLPNERGEICLRGPQMMQGYYKRQDETDKVIRKGRLHTGDVGYIDEDGFVYIVDRVKDVVLVGGYNVYPRHVEEVIYTHPAVEECIVAGVPDKLRGEAVHAWVKPKTGNPLDAEHLKAFLKDKLSPIEMPRKIIVRQEPLPKTAVGKLSKRALLEQEGIVKS